MMSPMIVNEFDCVDVVEVAGVLKNDSCMTVLSCWRPDYRNILAKCRNIIIFFTTEFLTFITLIH